MDYIEKTVKKNYIYKGGKSLLTERYKDIILQEQDELETLLSGWEEENNLPAVYADMLRTCIKS